MLLNEQPYSWQDGLTLEALIQTEKPQADLAVVDGQPIPAEAWGDTVLAQEARVVLLRRGERPTRQELRGLIRARHTPGVGDVLERATVGIAGVGGLGSHVADALARSGVGHLVLVDYDVVEPSNLNRQLYTMADLGYPKVAAFANRLIECTPLTQVLTHAVRLTPENIADIFRECDIVVECLDAAEQKRMLVETLLAQLPQVPVVAASGMAGTGPSNTIHTRKVMNNLILAGDESSDMGPGCGLMAPRVMITAGHQANAVVRHLLRCAGKLPDTEEI